MLNFPLPYPNELIYSTIARYRIRLAIQSPKEFLSVLFKHRSQIATLDLPSYLPAIEMMLPGEYHFERLLYQHTLFPLYAPFIPELHRKKCFQHLQLGHANGLHLLIGMAASLISSPLFIRYCPECQKKQKMIYGEYFWNREWQITGAETCLEHGVLLNSSIARPLKERHHFIDASPENCPQNQIISNAPQPLDRITYHIHCLLSLPPQISPTYTQWTAYYQHMAQKKGFMRNKTQVDHRAIYHKVLAVWPKSVLQRYGLDTQANHATNWLHCLFRKHRKSFSYLAHILVNEAILGSEFSIEQMFKQVALYPRTMPPKRGSEKVTILPFLSSDQEQWRELLKSLSPKQARRQQPALYTRLYRNYHSWLLIENKSSGNEAVKLAKSRIDWHQRDYEYAEKLTQLEAFFSSNPLGPRRSTAFYLKSLPHTASVEKNVYRLPLVRAFLLRNTETIEQYQVRRINNAYNQLRIQYLFPPRWRLLRLAGLSEIRLSGMAKLYLKELLDDKSKRHQR